MIGRVMDIFAAELGLLADVSRFHLFSQSRITKHERFLAGDGVSSRPTGLAR